MDLVRGRYYAVGTDQPSLLLHFSNQEMRMYFSHSLDLADACFSQPQLSCADVTVHGYLQTSFVLANGTPNTFKCWEVYVNNHTNPEFVASYSLDKVKKLGSDMCLYVSDKLTVFLKFKQ